MLSVPHTLSPISPPLSAANEAVFQMPLQPGNDFVFLNALELKSIIGPEAWHRSSRIQPVVLDIRMQTDLMLAANTDDVLKTVHYGNLCKAVTGVVEDSGPFESLREFAQIVTEKALRCGEGGDVVDLSATLPKGLLLAEGIGISTRRVKRKDSGSVLQTEIVFETLFVRNMKLACIIGVNPHERLEKQFVVINLAFYDVEEIVFKDYAKLIKKISDYVESSSYETLETLATSIGRVACSEGSIGRITISVQKPSALTFVGGSGVEITRDRRFYQNFQAAESSRP